MEIRVGCSRVASTLRVVVMVAGLVMGSLAVLGGTGSMPTASAASPSSWDVTVYGPADASGGSGRFYGLADGSRPDGTHNVHVVPSASWASNWPAGSAAYFPTLTGDGRVVMGTNFLTQGIASSKNTLDAVAFDPSTNGLTKLGVATCASGTSPCADTSPQTLATKNHSSPSACYPTCAGGSLPGYENLGGADVGDVCATQVGTTNERVVTTVSNPYGGWHVVGGNVYLLRARDGDTYTLQIGGPPTATLAYADGPNVVKNKLVSLGVPADNVSVARSIPGDGYQYNLITFRNGSASTVLTRNVVAGTPELTTYQSNGVAGATGMGVFPSVLSIDTTRSAAHTQDDVVSRFTSNNLAANVAPGFAGDIDKVLPVDRNLGFSNFFGEGGKDSPLPLRNSHQLAECEPLGDSGDIAIVQYGGARPDKVASPSFAGSQILVMDSAGRLKAVGGSNVDFGATGGCANALNPRNLSVSGPDSAGARYLAVVYDANHGDPANGCVVDEAHPSIVDPFPLQVFKWDGSTVTPVTGLIVPPNGSRFNFTTWGDADATPTLFAATSSGANYMVGDTLFAFAVGTDSTGMCNVTTSFSSLVYSNYSATTCPTPSVSLGSNNINGSNGYTAALNFDPSRRLVYAVGSGGRMSAFNWLKGSSAYALSATAAGAVDLGARLLCTAASPPNLQYPPNTDCRGGVRKGVIDAAGARLFVVYQEQRPAIDGDQYLFAVDLSRLFGQPFRALPPTRVFDSRVNAWADGTSGKLAASPPGTSTNDKSVRVAGVNGIPSSATAVVVNVTVSGATASSYLTAYPTGSARPTTAVLNFAANQTLPNLATIPIGDNGRISFSNNMGQVDVILDVAGYYDASSPGLRYTALSPSRLFDSGTGTWLDGTSGALKQDDKELQVTGRSGIPSGASAVVLNVSVKPAGDAFLTVYPGGGPTAPLAANLNLQGGVKASNLVTVQLGTTGTVRFHLSAGSARVIVDVAGYYDTNGADLFFPLAPTRILDSRTSLGFGGPIGAGSTGSRNLVVLGAGGVPNDSNVHAVVMNLAVTQGTASSWMSAYPSGAAAPTGNGPWNIDFAAGETRSSLAITRIGNAGKVTFFNWSGTVHATSDVGGYFKSP